MSGRSDEAAMAGGELGMEATVAAIDVAAPDWFAPLDRHASRILADLVGETDERVRLALALVSRQVRSGHVCLDLPAVCASPGPVGEYGAAVGELQWPPLAPWLDALAASPLVAVAPDGAEIDSLSPEPRPLVLELPRGRLYLRRWWEHEAALARDLLARAGRTFEPDCEALAESLARLFPAAEGPNGEGTRDQADAAARAVRHALTVITGGPGTGKTTTVVRVLALLAEQASARGEPPPRILLLAPTGKAAARLEEAVLGARDALAVSDEARAAIPADGRTIHRALGVKRDGTWRHNADEPLVGDVVVVDEASMIDVALMRALVEAVRPDARLIVLGDRDQLASVDAGAVLADMCVPPSGLPSASPSRPDLGMGEATPSGAQAPGASEPGASAPSPPIADCIAVLSYSFRFGPDTGIGALARAVLAGDADRAVAILDDPAWCDVRRVDARPADRAGRLHPVLEELVADGFGSYLDAIGTRQAPADLAGVAQALAALGRFRVLCGHRRGPLGAGQVGRAVVDALGRRGRISATGEQWHGRPVIVTRNDYGINLFNGDVGLIAGDAELGGRLRAFFPGGGDRLRELAPARLPPHETVFAMSIHKSQGSEFDDVAVVLPEEGSPLLTRELVYTAVTRARRSVTLFGTEGALRTAIGRRAERASGLAERLWRP